jgi:ketosteroid isomerase-like protein
MTSPLLQTLVALGVGLLLVATANAGATRRTPKRPSAENAVRAVLDAQVAAWNRGDIDEFMNGYDRSPSTRFASGGTVTRGWDTVMQRYKTNYATPEKMGTLAFTDLEISVVSPTRALAFGRWKLTRAGDTPNGLFTLLFEKTKAGWKIVADHTSSTE